MLKIENLCAGYDGNTVIEDLTYTFENGKKYAVTGASGIGKTTLIKVIAGLLEPTSGSVSSEHRAPSYIFQEPRLFPWLTALDNVKLVCNDETQAAELLKKLIPDTDVCKKYPHELSGGMKQRVAIARALAYSSDLVLMDEPFKGLDEELRRSVREFVFDYLRDKTVIMITHDEEDTEACDVVLRMTSTPVGEFEIK